MKNTRIVQLDLIKFLACIMIVILHGIGVGHALRELIYLSGAYGIPLFFLTNGYLRFNQSFTFTFVKNISLRYIRFIFIWSIIIFLIKKEDYPALIKGAVFSNGSLFHLWFLTGLVVIYTVLALVRYIAGEENLQFYVQRTEVLAVCLIAMTLSFIFNIYLSGKGIEIRDYISAPFRIITNGSYFLAGMYIRHREQDFRDKPIPGYFIVIAALISTIFIYALATSLNMRYASSYYSFVPVFITTAIIFISIRDQKTDYKRNIRACLRTSTGIWILHPLIIEQIRKILCLLNIEDNLLISIICTVAAILLCVMITLIFQRVKILRKLVQV